MIKYILVLEIVYCLKAASFLFVTYFLYIYFLSITPWQLKTKCIFLLRYSMKLLMQ